MVIAAAPANNPRALTLNFLRRVVSEAREIKLDDDPDPLPPGHMKLFSYVLFVPITYFTRKRESTKARLIYLGANYEPDTINHRLLLVCTRLRPSRWSKTRI